MNIHTRIKELRVKRGFSQDELAAAIGTSQVQISKYERIQEPTAHVIDRLADVLETTADYLIGRTDIADRPKEGLHDLNSMEKDVIDALRAMDTKTRNRAVNVLKALAEPG